MSWQVVGTILGRVYSMFPDAAAVKYTVTKPMWLFGWSSKWQHLGPELRVLELRAYDSSAGGGMARVMYVPLFS
jgi:hypothetical protein